ncbi:MAG TPA: class I SAM-dependent methyltransferase [Dictyobacter sp.]|nr:class I SAM-dependent methyltransferase [Dictyobacter sp.]
MPLRLTLPEMFLARLNLLPTPLFDTPLSAGIAKVLVTACELGLFDLLDHRQQSLSELALQLQCDEQGLQLLLQLLVAAGYLRDHRGSYANTAVARRWLTLKSRWNIAPYIIHSPDIVAIWDRLPEVIRTGQSAMRMPYEDDVADPTVQSALARHYAGLASLATSLGGDMLYRLRLPANAIRLLDVGGSHAAYSALFCQKYTRLHATIFDIQPGIDAGQRTAKRLRLEERMSFVCGDFVHDDFAHLFDESFDVVLYFHIAHLLTPELNQEILQKVSRVLNPGGLFVFVDQVIDQVHGSYLASLIVQFMAVTMRTVGGTCYPFPTVKSWLQEADMEKIQHHRLLTPGATMITARKR